MGAEDFGLIIMNNNPAYWSNRDGSSLPEAPVAAPITENVDKSNNDKSQYEAGRTQATKVKEGLIYVRFEVHEDGARLPQFTYGQFQVPEDANKNATMFQLPIMPTDITRTQSIRNDVQPTTTYSEQLQPIATVDSWGHSVPQWNIKGHTAYRKRNGIDGFQSFVSLCTFFENYQKENIFRIKEGRTLCSLLLCNSTDTWQDFWYVEPVSLPSKHRSADKPLLYYYDMTFVGVEMFADSVYQTDAVADALADPAARIKMVSRSLGGNITNLQNMTSFVPQTLKTEMNNIIGSLQSIKNSITGYVAPVKSFLISVNSTINDINDFQKKLRNSIRDELSPIFEVTNQFNQVACSLKTLVKIPQDFYSDMKSDLKNLANSVHASGCGTTLRTGGTAMLSAGKVGFAGLYGAR